MKEIPLGRGHVALVDDEDFEVLSQTEWRALRGSKSKVLYAIAVSPKPARILTMHSLLLEKRVGVTVDHIDRNGLNNQRSNLRYATKAQQEYNKPKKTGTLHKYKGVAHNPYCGPRCWQARARVDKKDYSLGYHLTAKDAAIAYDAFMYEHCREYAVLNFPVENRQ